LLSKHPVCSRSGRLTRHIEQISIGNQLVAVSSLFTSLYDLRSRQILSSAESVVYVDFRILFSHTITPLTVTC